jgi:hypothetical protein
MSLQHPEATAHDEVGPAKFGESPVHADQIEQY